jgi:hypothetical protein
MTALLVVGILFWWTCRNLINGHRLKKEREAAETTHNNYKVALKAVLHLRDEFEKGQETVKESRELERRILEDAINREGRALLALFSCLRVQGCTEAQIEYVLDRTRKGEV